MQTNILLAKIYYVLEKLRRADTRGTLIVNHRLQPHTKLLRPVPGKIKKRIQASKARAHNKGHTVMMANAGVYCENGLMELFIRVVGAQGVLYQRG